MKRLLFIPLILISTILAAQTITTNPLFPIADKVVTITFNASGTDLEDYTGDIYAHTGVTIDGNKWQHVIGEWGNNPTQPKLTRTGTDIYQLEITPSINEFYNVTAEENVTELCFVFRSSDGGTQSEDLFVDVYEDDLSVSFIKPDNNILTDAGAQIEVEVAANLSNQLTLYVDDTELSQTTSGSITHTLIAANSGKHWIWAEATDGTNTVYDSIYYFIKEDVNLTTLPHGVHNGINYIDNNTVTLVLNAPEKEYVYLIGDFNDWDMSNTPPDGMTSTWMMNKTPEGNHFWLTLNNLEPGVEYRYQYLIDGDIRVADPYTEKVLDPWNDKYITEETYPGLISYPDGKTTEPVSVFQTAQTPYNWEVNDFTAPEVTDMVVYEMLIRDFVETHSYKTVADTLDYLERLGINVLELMPINEFEGNSSWGYNPSFYFAPDKYYGTKNDLKQLIDECHKRGIAVVIDMVLNHSYGQSPLARMYLENGKPAANNPWYNVENNFTNTAAHWGYDFDHESALTQQLVDSINSFWMSEYKVDGFRFDFTKGFGNNIKDGTDEWGSKYDADRVRLLKRMSNEIWKRNPDAYVIFEHLSENDEERELADHGILLWGNMNHSYNEATMGWNESGKSDFSWISYNKRGWSDPHVVGYMESHDEERLMYKNLQHGNSEGDYDVKELNTALKRVEAAAMFFITIPGPKMIWQFGELGFETSINQCTDGTVDGGCRLSEKQPAWEYLNDEERMHLFTVYQWLINMKKNEPVFSTDDFTLDVRGAVKRIELDLSGSDVRIIGNFGVTPASITPNFSTTGKWYEMQVQDSINVTDTGIEILLQPGEYAMYSQKKLTGFDTHISVDDAIGVEEELNVFPNPFNSNVTIQTSQDGIKYYELFSISGTKVMHGQFEQNIVDISWNKLPSGNYILRIKNRDKVLVKKLVKR